MTQFPAVQRIDLTSFSLGVLAELIGRGVGPATVALEASRVAGLFVPGEVLAASKALPTEVTTHRKFCPRGCDECHSTPKRPLDALRAFCTRHPDWCVTSTMVDQRGEPGSRKGLKPELCLFQKPVVNGFEPKMATTRQQLLRQEPVLDLRHAKSH